MVSLALKVALPATPRGSQTNLGAALCFDHGALVLDRPGCDPAGFPNGRRPDDDVTDIVVRVAGGADFIANFVGDGVGINEKGITPDFPFLPTPFDGRDRRHRDPGE